jgi:hypothetical protein
LDSDSNQQLILFNALELKALAKKGFKSEDQLQMSSEYLQSWKAQIYKHQHQMRLRQLPEQVTLFDLDDRRIDPEVIDPFNLTLHSFSFFRLPTAGAGIACIYFVMDSAAEIILYVGETCQSNKRWIGHHDCKKYLDKYKDLHYQHGLSTAINMAFWWDAPVKTRPRQELELALIQKWRAPFNKENWSFWSAPFV